MSKEEKTKQSESHDNFQGFPFAKQIRKMMEGGGGSCDCAQMMAKMSKCCGPGSETEKPRESAAAEGKQATE